MSDPSGEKRGSVSTPGVAVSRRAEPPLRPTTQRSPAYSNAMRSLLTAGCRRRRVPWALPVPATPARANVIAEKNTERIERVLNEKLSTSLTSGECADVDNGYGVFAILGLLFFSTSGSGKQS